MVGDDLLADIKGGLNAGVDTCWFNPGNLENKSGITPKYTVSSYEELYRIVMEPEELENIGVRNRRHSNEAPAVRQGRTAAAPFVRRRHHFGIEDVPLCCWNFKT